MLKYILIEIKRDTKDDCLKCAYLDKCKMAFKYDCPLLPLAYLVGKDAENQDNYVIKSIKYLNEEQL